MSTAAVERMLACLIKVSDYSIMNAAYALAGTIQGPRTVLLDEPLPVSSGRVIVMVQPEGDERPRPPYLDTVRRITAELEAGGSVPLSADEIAAWVEGERNAWE